MKLFTKAENAKLFANYSKGSNMANQNVVVKIFNPYGNGRWYIMNSDPNDPNYLWGIVDLGYGAEVGSISRSDLENYRNRFGWGFERDMSFRPKNAKMVLEGLRNGEFFAGGGEVEFIDYGDSEIMFEPNSKKYYANEMEFDTLEQAKKFIDSGEVPYFIKDAYSKGMFKKGGALLTPKQRYIAELKGLTGLQQKAIEDYIDENNLTSDEVLRIVIGLGRKQISSSDVSTAIVGKKNNSESKKLLAFAMSDEALKAEYGAFMDGVYAGGGSISNFDPMSLMGKTFYSLQSHGKIINVRILSDDNIKIKYEVSNTFSVEKSFTKKELFDMAKGKEVDGNSILKSTMANGGFMDGVYAGGGGVSDKFVITKKPDANSLYYIVYSENGKKVPSSELPTNIGYGKIKNEFLSKRKRYDNSLGLQDAVTIVMKMNDKESYSGGGKTTFADKSSAIAKNFVGKAVEPKYQKEYGKRYDAKEAKEVGNKIAGKQKASYNQKYMDYGGDFPDYGETVSGEDIDYDMKDYFNRTNKKLLITTKDKKQHINGAVTKFYNDLIFVAKDKHDIPVKDILKVEILKDNTANVEKPKKSMKSGGSVKSDKLKQVTQKAKEIRKEGEKWQSAMKRAYAMMK
jgi:hypothetical protein